MDPLQVSMTGVRMGERFLQIGCHDRALLAGLAAKVGLSGTAAVAAFDEGEAKRAARRRREGRRVDRDARIDEGRALPFAANSSTWSWSTTPAARSRRLTTTPARVAAQAPGARAAGRTDRSGRGSWSARAQGYDVDRAISSAAGFKPVRLLAERDGLRFIEGLRAD